MVTPYEVYVSYRKAKPTTKTIKIPSEQVYRNRLGVNTLWNIDRCTGYFNTIYSNIDLDTYMQCGYKVFKSFPYKQLINQKVLTKYKQLDKTRKRTVKTSNDRITESFKYIDKPLLNYCKDMISKKKRILYDYTLGRVDSVIVMYCIHHKLVSFDDIEEDYLYNIYNQYNKWVKLMFKYEYYIEELDKEKRFE